MREDVVSAWTVWRCPSCGRLLVLHDEAPLEPWCTTCHCPLEADPEIGGVER